MLRSRECFRLFYNEQSDRKSTTSAGETKKNVEKNDVNESDLGIIVRGTPLMPPT